MSVNPRKRNVVTKALPISESESENELGDGLLEGILSHSEDDSDASDEQEEEDDTDASSIIEGLSDEDEDDDDDGEGEDDIREQMRKLRTSDGPLKRKPGQQTHEMDLDAAAGGELDRDDEDLKPNYTVQTDANGNTRYIYQEINPVYESDDSDAEQTNTIGNIDLKYYDEYPHIGYDINGKKIMRPAKGEALDALLDSIDIPKGWTGLTDPTTGKPLQLSEEELDVLKKVTRNEIIEEGYDPYPEMIAYFSGVDQEIMPLSAAPEPKRRFIPSKHEAKRVMKIVKAIREGRIAPYKAPDEEEEEDQFNFDVWADEKPRDANSMHIAAPKLPPPGYEASYHPPAEYLPDKAEEDAWLEQ